MFEKCPDGHGVQAVLPDDEYVLTGQFWQDPLCKNVPAAHGVQTVLPIGAKLPVGQLVQVDAPPEAYVLTRQLLQMPDTVLTIEPPGQVVHCGLLINEKEPAGQAVHAVLPDDE